MVPRSCRKTATRMLSSEIAIERLQPPCASSELLALLSHKGSPWIDDIRRRAEGSCPESVDRFFIARSSAGLIGHVWYTAPAAQPRIGLLGHVYTRPECRRHGVARSLMQSAMAQFTASGGAVVLLFTSAPETLPFYEQLGFEKLHSKQVLHKMDWAMWHLAGSQSVVAELFAPSSIRVRRLHSGDLAMYCLLYNLEYQTRLKDWAQGIGTGLETEWTFITLCERIRSGQAVCWVAENDQTIVGIASLVRCGFAHQSHLAAIDWYTHAAFADTGRRLVDACLACRGDLGVEIVYALAADESKRREFSALAFTERSRLPGHYKIESARDDCWLFEVG